MIHQQGSQIRVSAGMTLEVAHRLLEEGGAVVAARKEPTEWMVDLSAVDTVDSSALAVLFGWVRLAKQQGHRLSVAHPPAQLMSLAQLYGVAELLPLA